ncbi:hypothetical protein G9C98_007108 [Cotesia typhae]|uniref:Uncharacterized protein n=1 Tax=Cotesia typhae TaxID=2053667 RepID=A0A8J5RA92_9HYME|nr:hypothetical protein G9C98_007108 [Cotesia typhae]
MSTAEMWSLVHACYGEELGLTSDDEDYIPPIAAAEEEKLPSRLSTESFSEVFFFVYEIYFYILLINIVL